MGVFLFSKISGKVPQILNDAPMHLETSSACALKFASGEMSIRMMQAMSIPSKHL